MVSKKAVELALLKKGQASKRYKLGEIWELNFDEIREALATVSPVCPEQQWIPVTERLPEKDDYKSCVESQVDGVLVTLEGVPITYEHMKDGFRFYVWTEDKDKAVEIVKEIVAKIKSEHDDPKHFVTW